MHKIMIALVILIVSGITMLLTYRYTIKSLRIVEVTNTSVDIMDWFGGVNRFDYIPETNSDPWLNYWGK